MAAKLQMTSRRKFGLSNRAQLSPALRAALQASGPSCETCREIEKDLDGGEYVEAASFPGKTIQKLDAHFKAHWNSDYELIG